MARRRRGRVVRQRPAKPRTAVRVRSAPLTQEARQTPGRSHFASDAALISVRSPAGVEDRLRQATSFVFRSAEAHDLVMSLLRRLACVARGGHRWETTTDVAGSISVCGRCGKLGHGGKSVSAGSPMYGVSGENLSDFDGRNPGP